MEKLPNILVAVVPHKEQRYDTAGDYVESVNLWSLTVSETPNWRYSALVMMHELIEMILTKDRNISWDEIDKFDTVGNGKNSNDPGSLEDAPYHKEHLFAEKIERLLCAELGLSWKEYNQELDNL